MISGSRSVGMSNLYFIDYEGRSAGTVIDLGYRSDPHGFGRDKIASTGK